MSKFKSIKEEMLKFMFEKTGFVSQLKDDGTKYGSIDMNDWVKNDVLGVVRVSEIRRLEDAGAITYQYGKWKVKTEPFIVDSSNINRFHKDRYIGEVLNIPTKAWYDYMESIKNKTQKLLDTEANKFESLNI